GFFARFLATPGFLSVFFSRSNPGVHQSLILGRIHEKIWLLSGADTLPSPAEAGQHANRFDILFTGFHRYGRHWRHLPKLGFRFVSSSYRWLGPLSSLRFPNVVALT